MRPSPITSTVDFDTDGVHHGFLNLPYSHDEAAWGAIMIPITVIRNGPGTIALLTGGNHGDEYEGPMALTKLASSLKAEDIEGCIIILPFLNYPAFRAGTRTSPIDKGNLNRTFPGKPDGTVTEKIADYVQRYILPRADYVLDLHAGGKTLDFVPFAAIHELEDKSQQERCAAAMRAFNAPYSMTLLELDSVGMLDTAVEALGKVFVSTELGGGGSVTAKSIAIADRGIRQFLIHAGILKGELELRPSTVLDMPDNDCYVISEHEGLLEMCKDLGEEIAKGELIACIYDTKRTGTPPVPYYAKRSGLIATRHFPGLVGMGDTIAVVADIQSELIEH